jgi:hypothetical protein
MLVPLILTELSFVTLAKLRPVPIQIFLEICNGGFVDSGSKVVVVAASRVGAFGIFFVRAVDAVHVLVIIGWPVPMDSKRVAILIEQYPSQLLNH